MPSLQILTHALDRYFATPARLSAIVGAGGKHQSVDALIGPVAEAADAATALANQKRYLEWAREKIEGVLQGRMLYRQRYRARMPGSNWTELQLPQWPVLAEGLEIRGVTKESYRVNCPGGRYLYRDSGWPSTNWLSAFTSQAIAGSEADTYRVDFWTDYLMPGQWAKWLADRAYITDSSASVDENAAGVATATWGSWTSPTDPTNWLRFECTTAGTTGSSEPAWPTAHPWEPATAYVAAAAPVPPSWVLAPNGPVGLWYECTVAGTSGATDSDVPAFPDTAGETVTETGGVEWTARDELTFAEGPDTLVWTGHFAEVLPIALQEMAARLAIELAKKTLGVDCEDDKCASDFAERLEMAA